MTTALAIRPEDADAPERPHAWSGDRRIPLQDWQVQPFTFAHTSLPKRVRSLPPRARPKFRHASPWPPGRALRRIIDETAEKFDVTPAEILGDELRRAVTSARFEVYHRARQETSLSFTQIGLRLGGRDHTTVMYGVREHARMLARQAAP